MEVYRFVIKYPFTVSGPVVVTSNKNQQQNNQEKVTPTTTTATTSDDKSPKIEVTEQANQITSFPFNAQVASQQQVVMTTQQQVAMRPQNPQQVQPQIRVALNKTPTIPNSPGLILFCFLLCPLLSKVMEF